MPSTAAHQEARSERLEARVPASLKATLKRAAAMQGRTLTDFVLSASTEAAERVIREHEVLELSRRDQEALARALLDPPAATPRLEDAARRYRESGTT